MWQFDAECFFDIVDNKAMMMMPAAKFIRR